MPIVFSRSRDEDSGGCSDYPNAYALGALRAPLVPPLRPVYTPTPPASQYPLEDRNGGSVRG